jgi:hypothetical protein
VTAARAFTTIPQSPLQLDLSAVLQPALEELTGFLRKANRPLRQTALSALEVRAGHAPACCCRSGPRCSGLCSPLPQLAGSRAALPVPPPTPPPPATLPCRPGARLQVRLAAALGRHQRLR